MRLGQVFISYRREDAGGYARAIFDKLVKRFSKDRIFMDVDAIEPGLAFDEVIDQAVGRCEVQLVLIGKRWLEPLPGVGPRINDPRDFVRAEIAAALVREIRVIPVLVDGAVMPGEDVLPEPLRPLARRNAIEVSNTRFDFDVDRLIGTVADALGESQTSTRSPARSRRAILYWTAGAIGIAGLVPGVNVLYNLMRRGPASADAGQPGWRFCDKCQSMFFDGYPAKGVCPAGGEHHAQGYNFVLPHDVPGPGQGGWRFCGKCQSIFFDGLDSKGVCAAGGAHVAAGFNFVLPHDAPGPGQPGWRYCQKCQTLFFDGYPRKGVCAQGGGHTAAGFNFVVPYT